METRTDLLGVHLSHLLGEEPTRGGAESLPPLTRPQGTSQTPRVLKICHDLTDVRAEFQPPSVVPTTWGTQ